MQIFNVYGVRPVSYKTVPLTKVQVARWNDNQGYMTIRGGGFTRLVLERKDFHNLTFLGGITVSACSTFHKDFLCLMLMNLYLNISARKYDFQAFERVSGLYRQLT